MSHEVIGTPTADFLRVESVEVHDRLVHQASASKDASNKMDTSEFAKFRTIEKEETSAEIKSLFAQSQTTIIQAL